jgi:hypothetical protein
LNSIRNLKTCTSIAAVLVALAAASAASAADRSRLPTFVGATFSFDSMGTAERLPSFSFTPAGFRALAAVHSTDTPAPSFTKTDEYKASWFLDPYLISPSRVRLVPQAPAP